MKPLARYLPLLFAACLIFVSSAFADTDKDDKQKRQRESPVVLQTIGSDPDPGQCFGGLANESLDVNNVQVRLLNIGSIAYGNGLMGEYFVPKDTGHSPLYAMGVWIGGMVGNELRVAGSRYADFEFWPGPLGPDGRPVNPRDCSAYDRLYKVSRSDIARYETTGEAVADLADWPYDLGAPVIDGDGAEGNYDLAEGDRPDLIGDQAVWWIMNDVGNQHRSTESAPIGMEVRVHAFAFNRMDALGDATFFKYNMTYKGAAPLTDAFFTIFVDPDIGNGEDDFVGVDTTHGLGYAYNSNAMDAVYGPAPAMGYDFLQGPVLEHGDTLGVTSFMYFINTPTPGDLSDPKLAQEVYNIQQGLWKGGQPLTAHGLGFETDGDVTKFAYPGDPVTGTSWSEVNNDGAGGRNKPRDRRFAMSTGPFTMQPGESQDIVFGILFAQGVDNLDSITRLREADEIAQAAFDAGFGRPMKPTSVERVPDDPSILEASIDDISIVPNPYRLRSAYEAGVADRRVRFTNMPQTATVQIYTVRGTRIRTLYKDGPGTSLDWDLLTDHNWPVASGMYFIHIEVPGVGEKIMKFGVVNRETTASGF